MVYEVYFIIFGAALGLLVFVAAREAVKAYVKYRGLRVVTCPETHQPVGVKVDASHAALTAISSDLDLRLTACTRWPERQDCDQACIREIAADPEACLYWTKMINWYEGKSCAYCGKTFGRLNWSDHKPALLDGEDKLHEWAEVPPERLEATLPTQQPVCWNCFIAESFRTLYPERIVDRNYRGVKLH